SHCRGVVVDRRIPALARLAAQKFNARLRFSNEALRDLASARRYPHIAPRCGTATVPFLDPPLLSVGHASSRGARQADEPLSEHKAELLIDAGKRGIDAEDVAVRISVRIANRQSCILAAVET